jgi:hypothetical protein
MATVRDTSTENKINIVTTTENNVNVTQPVTSIVTISALGPQGAQGPQGQPGEIPSTGSFVLTSSFNSFTSSYYVDSASFNINISNNSSSISLLSGSFKTTSGSFSTRITNLENFSSSLDATFATDAELNAATASLSASISNLSSSFKLFSGSYNTGSFTGSFTGDGSQLTGIVSSKWTGSNPITREGNVEITGSLIISGSSTFINIGPAIFSGSVTSVSGFTGSLLGTASFATSASQAVSSSFTITASFAQTAQTASYVLQAVSASFATSASFAVSASRAVTASYASFVTASNVIGTVTSSSYALTIILDNYVPPFPFTGSALITGSLGVTGSLSTRAQGALSTDIAFRVRNSANSQNIISVLGNGNTVFNNQTLGQTYLTIGQIGASHALSCFIDNGTGAAIRFNYGIVQNGLNLTYNTTSRVSGVYISTTRAIGDATIFFDGGQNIRIGQGYSNLNQPDLNATRTIQQMTGVAPTTSPADGFQQYSADRNGVAGKASPHFRTEDGTVLWLGDESRLFNVTASRTIISSSQNTISGSSLTVYGSGSAQPVFTVQGSSGELFSVTDSLTGSLFSVNDISGLPILEVFSDNTTLIGNYLDPMLITTAKVTQTNSGSFVVYSLPTASYDTAFFEYSVKSGSNARAGTIMAIQSGSSVNFTETTTLDFGSTTAISFTVVVTGSNMALTGSSTAGAWTIKSIVRGI